MFYSIEGTTAEDRCVGTVGEVGAICFCREYTRDKTLGCNSDYEAVIYAIREVVNSFSKQVVIMSAFRLLSKL